MQRPPETAADMGGTLVCAPLVSGQQVVDVVGHLFELVEGLMSAGVQVVGCVESVACEAQGQEGAFVDVADHLIVQQPQVVEVGPDRPVRVSAGEPAVPLVPPAPLFQTSIALPLCCSYWTSKPHQ